MLVNLRNLFIFWNLFTLPYFGDLNLTAEFVLKYFVQLQNSCVIETEDIEKLGISLVPITTENSNDKLLFCPRKYFCQINPKSFKNGAKVQSNPVFCKIVKKDHFQASFTSQLTGQ